MGVRVLLIGDIVGSPGKKVVQDLVPALRRRERVDAVIANAENVAAGSGITPALADKIFKSGVDLITMGDHVYGKRDGLPLLEKDTRIVRPLNYPSTAIGRGLAFHELEGGAGTIAVLQVQGRVFMGPSDCPFRAADEGIEKARARGARMVFLDVHAEATSEKIAMGWFLDGRVSCVFGTHTHVQTADERILPKGTAYITDLGMTGPYESVIGREIAPVLRKFTSNMPTPFEVAANDVRISGAVVEVDPQTGRAIEIKRLHVREGEAI
jgi:2',3'-cyclic-nucleotide 2'-phosphodiesterase